MKNLNELKSLWELIYLKSVVEKDARKKWWLERSLENLESFINEIESN